MSKQQPNRLDQVVTDVLAYTDDYRDEAAQNAAGRRLAAYTPDEINAAKDELRADRVGFDANKINAIRRR